MQKEMFGVLVQLKYNCIMRKWICGVWNKNGYWHIEVNRNKFSAVRNAMVKYLI